MSGTTTPPRTLVGVTVAVGVARQTAWQLSMQAASLSLAVPPRPLEAPPVVSPDPLTKV